MFIILIDFQIHNTTFQTELPDWDLLKEIDSSVILDQINNNRDIVIEKEKDTSHSYLVLFNTTTE